MENQPLVSIVLPFFNGKEFILETLNSIRNQTFLDFEVVVVDDGSTAGEHSSYLTAAIDELHDPRFKYFHKKNGGLSDARNFGISQSKGSWIAFIDQDDLWDSIKLAKQVEIIKQQPDINFIFTDGRFIGDIEAKMKVAQKNSLKEGVVCCTYDRLLKGNFVICSSILFRKSLSNKVGGSNPFFKIIPDYDFIIRIAEHTDFYFIEDDLTLYRIHGANTVKNQLKMCAEVILLLCERKIETKSQKMLATYNLITAICVLSANWIKKMRSR